MVAAGGGVPIVAASEMTCPGLTPSQTNPATSALARRSAPVPRRGRLLIENPIDRCPQPRRRAGELQVPAQPGADIREVLEERAALRAMLGVALDLESGDRIHLAIEVRLDTQHFSALHEALLRLPSASYRAGQRAPGRGAT